VKQHAHVVVVDAEGLRVKRAEDAVVSIIDRIDNALRVIEVRNTATQLRKDVALVVDGLIE
jgi:hypothetical protein